MIRRAGHIVNAGLSATRTRLPVVAGVDFAASVSNVIAWGGQAWLYARGVVAGLAAAGPDVDRELARSVGSLAGWRSGVLDLRADARARLAALSGPEGQRVAGAVLGLPPDAVGVFADQQEQRPLAWPLLAPDVTVAWVGGFRGLGGPWSSPPRSVVRDPAGDLLVRCADASVWRLKADVFAHRLTRADARPTPDETDVRGTSVGPRSYLVGLSGALR